MSAGTKRPHGQMLNVAQRLLERLCGACHRIEIAGSLRRGVPMVSDIEIMAVPKMVPNLFGEPGDDSELLHAIRRLPVRVLRSGPAYTKLEVVSVQGTVYPVDIFHNPDPATWGVNMMIRTGAADFSRRMVTDKRHGGYKPDHLRVSSARVWDGSQAMETPEEADVFRVWGMDYVEPGERGR